MTRVAWNVAADHVASSMGELSKASAQLINHDPKATQLPEYYEANRLWLQLEEFMRKLRDRAAGREAQP